MKHKRWEALASLRTATGIALVVAAVVAIAADVLVMARGGLVDKLLAAIDAGLVIAFGLLPAAQLLLDDEVGYSPNANGINAAATVTYGGGGALLATLAGVARAAKAVVDQLRGVLNLVKGLGWMGQALADAAVMAAQTVIGGPGMAILNALLEIAKQAGGALLEGGVHALYGVAYAVKWTFDGSLNMDIGDWCKDPQNGCEAAPPRYHTVQA